MKPTDRSADMPPTVLEESGDGGEPIGSEPTLAATAPPTAGAPRSSLPGYELEGVIGKGGMGEVVLARDDRIGRDVAIKRMRAESPTAEAVARFLREARIQARLEHPAIVPVHELGRDIDGQPFFTMKRLAGVTLLELLRAATPPSRPRLLRAFVDVCSAVEFAHSRGVIHRDLKPANIILGEFNEVYVLDWGLAKVIGTRDPRSIASDVQSLDGMTQVGAVLGTPGYMPPEQVRGDDEIGPAADVYALGSILFEILAGESLHPPGAAALRSTLGGIEGSPARRKPDRGIPPELDDLCVASLRTEPGQRPSAKALARSVERYLDGDRDLEQRRKLSAEWLGKAREALAADAGGRRAEAIQHAGRALALDPESREAAETFARIVLEPPRELPESLNAELDVAEAAVQRRQSRVAMLSFVAVFVFLLLLSWNGVSNVGVVVAVAALAGVMAAAAFRLSRRRARPSEMLAVVVGNACLAALLSRAFGSLIVAPAVTCVMAVSLTSYPQLIDRAKLVIGILLASWIVPVALEHIGWLDPSWRVAEGRILSMSSMVTIGGTSTENLLVAANLITIAVIGLFANALARSRRDAQRRSEIQAWHLRQLIPAAEAPL